MKKATLFLLASTLAFGIANCSFAINVNAEQTTMMEASPADSISSVSEISDELENGYTITGDGYYSVVQWFEYDGYQMFGRFYYPENFDESKEYTTLLLCHGGNITADFWDAVYAPALAEQGYVCYAFDCRSGTGDSVAARTTYSDPTEDGTADVNTYAEDMSAALTFIKAQSYVNSDNLYLAGQSQGGMAAQIVGAQRSDEVAGIIVLYGSVMEQYKEDIDNFDELETHPYCNGEVLFIQGTEDNFRTPEDTIENMSWYEECTFVLISNAYHGFGNSPSRAADICTQNMLDFLERTSVIDSDN